MMPAITPGRRVRVTVPATSANLGPGYDTLGLALAIYDDVEIEAFADDRLEFDIAGAGAENVPRNAHHLVVRSLDAALERFGIARTGLRVRAHNVIPHGRGLGSSGAAVVAGVLAAAGLVADQRRVPPEELLAIASSLEGHPDNVAPCLFGGLTIAWIDANGDARSKQLAVHRGVSVLALVPEQTMSTKLARTLQPEHVAHADAIFNLSRSALLVAALIQSPELLLEATEDRLHQGYRAAAMPHTAKLVAALRAQGIAAVVSGAGPSVLVLCADPGLRLRAVDIARESSDTTWHAVMTAVDVRGATVEAATGSSASATHD